MTCDVVAAHEELAALMLDDRARQRWREDPARYAREQLNNAAERDMLASLDPAGLDWTSARLQGKAEAREQNRIWRAQRHRAGPPPPTQWPAAAPVQSGRKHGRPLVGLAYRPALFRRLFAHLDQIQVWEHTVDGFLHEEERAIDAMATFASQGPVTLHSLDLSVGSPQAQEDPERLKRIRALIEAAGASEISDHLGYSRITRRGLPHFAPLWRVAETLEIVVHNVAYLQDVLSARLGLENIALSFDPGGEIGTAEFLNEVARRTGCGIHLDITNLTINHANGFLDARTELSTLDLNEVTSVHLAGGAYADGAMRDMHAFPVSNEDLDWLERLVGRMPNCKTVVIERDGRQLGFEVAEDLARVHAAVSRGVCQAVARPERAVTTSESGHAGNDRWLVGTFREHPTDRHVTLRSDLLESPSQSTEPDWLPVLACGNAEREDPLAALQEALAGTGVAKLCLERALSNGELVSLSERIGPILAVPQGDPSIARHTEDRVVLDVENDGDPLEGGPSRKLFTDEAVLLHTELSWAPERRRPRFVLLGCVHAAEADAGGQTVLASMDSTSRHLDEEQLDILLRLRRFAVPDASPIASRRGRRVVFSHRDLVPFEWCCRAPSGVRVDEVNGAVSALLRAMYTSISCRIRWAAGDIVVFDNTRWFHGRTVQHPGLNRALKRVLVGGGQARAASMSL
jgi:uncharacterized protein (UPF0276 family)/alpha-ketoglutarate-dependent taurine dioxygenase